MKRARGAADVHARFLELLSRRLDEPLAADDARQLDIHLSGCDRCRAAQRDYAEQRRALRALPAPAVPRDLGARVSAALDREVLRTPARGRRLPVPVVGRPSVAGTSAVAAVAVMTVSALAIVSAVPPALPEASGLRPTPLTVPNQPLAFLGEGPDGLALYRTSVDQVCPVSAIDCVDARDETAVLEVSRPLEPNSMALDPTGERVAISGRDADTQDDVFAVLLIHEPAAGPPVPATAAPQVTAAPSETPGPTATLAATPAVTASAEATPSSEPPETSQPPATSSTSAPTPTVRASGLSSATPATTADPTPTDSPTDSAPPPTEPPTPSSETASPAITIVPSPGTPTPVSSATALTLVAILEDVRAAGAAPAWSADGGTLAFSAMPADGSHGPDVYVWRPGDDSATPITSDHRTYFASWSGSHIVASRVVDDVEQARPDRSPAGAAAQSLPPAIPRADGRALAVDPAPVARTVLIDPASAAESVVDGPSVWLPQVNAARTRAVAWQGRLVYDEAIVRPAEGALYLLDWAAFDPFAPAAEGTGRAIVGPLEPARDPATSPVLDWEARWAPDGTAVGFWIADVPAAAWGRLTVLAVDAAGDAAVDAPLVPATLARRSFTLGLDRVAWIAPSDAAPDGELRITVWGPDGPGVLRVSDPELEGLLAGF